MFPAFKERLLKSWELAKSNLNITQNKMKVWYVKNAKSRSFIPGDQVLVLLPIQG